MFKTLKQLFTKKNNKDLRKRLYFTIAVLTLYIIGIGIQVPNINLNDQIGALGFLELLDVMGGGGLKRFSIFGLGVVPYITASIVIQLLQMDIIPYFSDLAKQGHTGKQKLNQITRYLGIAFALFQGFAMSYIFLNQGYSVLEIVSAFESATGMKVKYEITERRTGDIGECYADPSKALEELGWKAEYGIDEMCQDAWNFTKNQS